MVIIGKYRLYMLILRKLIFYIYYLKEKRKRGKE